MTQHTATKSTPLRRAATFCGIVLNIIVPLLTIISAYGGMVNPNTTAIPALLALTFPVMLVFTIILTGINCIWWRRRAIFGAASLILCLGPILTYCPLNFLRPSEKSIAREEPPALKIMTFNVLGFHDFTGSPVDSIWGNRTLHYILQCNPDIALCQEATPIFERDMRLLPASDTTALARQYPYRYTSRRGMAIFSKYPFHRVEVPVGDENAYDVCRYDVNVNGTLIHLFNVHLQSIGLTPDDKTAYRNITNGDAPMGGMGQVRRSILHKLAAAFRARAFQADEVRAAIDGTEGNVILAGDFNDIPGSYASRVIQGSDMTDAYLHAGLGPAITYHADRLYFRIDQIFYRGDIDALRVNALHCPWSDHYPLLAYFRLPATSK